MSAVPVGLYDEPLPRPKEVDLVAVPVQRDPCIDPGPGETGPCAQRQQPVLELAAGRFLPGMMLGKDCA